MDTETPTPTAAPPPDATSDHQLREVLAAVPGYLSTIGSSLVGATAFLLISGASYYQALLEHLHATWAVDTIPYTAMVRAGALNALIFLLTTTITVAVTVVGLFTRRQMASFCIICIAVVCASTGLSSLQSVRGSRCADTLAFVTTLAGAYLVATGGTALIARKPTTPLELRWAALGGTVVKLGLLMFWPYHVGKLDAEQVLQGEARSRHPDVCIKGDGPGAWRMVRAVEDRYLVISPEPDVVRLRLVPASEVTDVLVSLPRQPVEGGPPALASASRVRA
ncbi:hypothetical protein [Luteibacter aegosomatissinici]|uniref:hypothetical protein n=1 Tax=Luteibacter aegosomatissinici TaxID=2911539 RepID=UPI001FFBA7BA|nr:hypothetical protein [Luteibacter aegosomatissinici]UPG92755.1 hypothetical protein L2Y97_12860 [Luteibacter aegosomatissinici]